MSNFSENIERLIDRHGLEQLAEYSGLTGERLGALGGGEMADLSEVLAIADGLGIGLDRLVRGKLPGGQKRKIKLLVLDVDGVMTSGGMYVSESGDESKKFHTRDGRGIMELRKAGVKVAFLSGSLNANAIHLRGKRLGVDKVFAGRKEKTEILAEWLAEFGIEWEDVAFIGDDLNDLKVMAKVGYCACPADAIGAVKQKVDVVLSTQGGKGCVREFVEDYIDY